MFFCYTRSTFIKLSERFIWNVSLLLDYTLFTVYCCPYKLKLNLNVIFLVYSTWLLIILITMTIIYC